MYAGMCFLLFVHALSAECKIHEAITSNIHTVSQLAESMWSDPGLKSGISVHKLISTLKKKKSAGGDLLVKHSPKILTREEKATTTTIWKT